MTEPAAIGRYAIEAEVGRGTMGIVYRAKDTVLERRVALKTVAHFGVAAGDQEAFDRRFLNEARAAAALSHPNIVAVHDFGRDPVTGTLFIALELLDGETLDAVIRRGPMEWRRACRIVARVARALHAAHASGIVHRDVKPANIMLLPSGEPKIMDFGIARVPASELTRAGEVFGTPSNMSPEQASGEAIDGRSDLFSLGTVLYQLLTGRRAFTGENLPKILAAVVTHTPPPPSQLASGVPAGVDRVIAKALAKSAGDRYQTGDAMATALEAALDGVREDPALATIALPATQRVPAGSHRSRFAIPAVAALVLLVVGLALWRAASGRRPSDARVDPPRAAGASAPASDAPARLAVDFEHHIRSGALKVWVDDDLVVDRALDGRLVERLGRIRLYKEHIVETVKVTPERHSVRVEVAWDGKVRTARSAATFRPDSARTLDIEVTRVLDDLSLAWR